MTSQDIRLERKNILIIMREKGGDMIYEYM